MTFKFAIVLFIAFYLVAPTESISCFSTKLYTDEIRETAGHQFCTAIFNVEFEEAQFGGSARNPMKIEKFGWDRTKNLDCQNIIHHNTQNQPAAEVYFCACFSNLCNFPYSYKEFVARGFTLEKSSASI